MRVDSIGALAPLVVHVVLALAVSATTMPEGMLSTRLMPVINQPAALGLVMATVTSDVWPPSICAGEKALLTVMPTART